MPSTSQRLSDLETPGCPIVGIPRSLLRLYRTIECFWRWQGFLWAFSYIYLKASAFVVQTSTRLDSVAHCDAVVQGIHDAWSNRQSAVAFAALRRLGAGSRRKRMVKGLPILHDMHGVPVASAGQASRRWQQHFGTLELAATFDVCDVPALTGHFARVPYAGVPTSGVALNSIASLSEFQRSCRKAKTAAAGCDGISGGLLHAFATELAELYYPLQLKCAVSLVEPLQWKGGFYRELLNICYS